MNAPTEQSSVSQSSISLGEQLRQARQALSLSLEDVSKEIALRPSILELIENNELVHKSIPSTFMEGYVRSYAKFLRLPDSVWENATFGEVVKNDLSKTARSSKAVNQYSSHHHWIGYLTGLVLLVVVGMTGLWWWQSYQQSNAERDTLVQNYTESTTETTPVETANSQNNVAMSATVETLPVTESTPKPTEVSIDNSNTAVSVENSTNTIAENQSVVASNNEPVSSTMSQVPDNSLPQDLTAQATEATALPDAQSAVENPVITQTPATIKGDLVIEITGGTSWISVKDKNRKVLAQKEYKQGETLSFDGNEYSVIIGAPGNVKITYKGEVYPLKVDGRIAKFKLPRP